MELFIHLLKRVGLVLAGYLVGLIAGFGAILLIYGVLSSLPNAPEYFAWVGAGSLLLLLAPPIALMVYLVAIYVTGLPALAAAIITEVFGLRAFWLHMIFGALVAMGGLGLVMPLDDVTLSSSNLADFGILAGSGLVGGFVYWLIAGREAGLKPPRPAPAYTPLARPELPGPNA